MTEETGAIAPWGYFNVQLASEMLRESGSLVTRPIGEVLPTSMPGSLSLAIRQPAGVVAAFAPWNAPVILGIRSVAAPLAAGNTVVMKPSDHAPLSAGPSAGRHPRRGGLSSWSVQRCHHGARRRSQCCRGAYLGPTSAPRQFHRFYKGRARPG